MDLLDHLTPEIERFSDLCCVHVALMGTTLQFFHEPSIKRVCEKLSKRLDLLRLKDLERLLLVLTMFNYDPKTEPDIYEGIYKELHKEQRRKEFIQYKHCLSSALNYFSYRNIYSSALMNELFDPQSITDIYGIFSFVLVYCVFNFNMIFREVCEGFSKRSVLARFMY